MGTPNPNSNLIGITVGHTNLILKRKVNFEIMVGHPNLSGSF